MLLSAFLAVALSAPPDSAKPFEFKDGDRLVWLGNTLVEREQRYGYWEAALLAAHADKTITVRNLGWSGDNVFGEARVGFDLNQPNKGFERMVSLTLELKPTVIFVNFGANEAFEGKEGQPRFEKGLEKLLDALKPTSARVVLFSPRELRPTPSLPDPKPANANLALYRDSIKAIAAKRELRFADLFDPKATSAGPLTDNGLHLTEVGYRETAGFFLSALGVESPAPSGEKLEPLRQAVLAKNEQFFNKWRPQNETYLFGFRKHEQGKNAKEIAEFDPFIEKAEAEIARIRKGLK